jgi:ATP-binding cassette subfamily C protein
MAGGMEMLALVMGFPLLALLLGTDGSGGEQFAFPRQVTEFLGVEAGSVWVLVVVAGVIFTKFAVEATYLGQSLRLQQGFTRTMRLQMFENLFAIRYSMLANETSRITNAITAQSMRAAGALLLGYQILQKGVIVLATILIAGWISWPILLSVGVLTLVVLLVSKPIFRFSVRMGKRMTELDRELLRELEQVLRHYRYIRCANLMARFQEQYWAVVRETYSVRVRFAFFRRLINLAAEPVSICIFLIIYLLTFVFPLSVEGLFIFAYALRRGYTQASQLVSSHQQLLMQIQSLHYCDRLLNDLAMERSHHAGATTTQGVESIRGEGVAFDYGEGKPIIRDADFHIVKGEVSLLWGPSGSGKTTLLQILVGLLEPQRGELIINDIPIQEVDLASYRQRIGLVGQEGALFPLTIRENLTLRAPEASDGELWGWIERLGLTDVIEREGGLDHCIDENSSNLSGGEKQRISLIRELLIEPDILFLDEPTSALDETSRGIVQEILSDLRGETAVVLISHQREYVSLADRILHIENGLLTETTQSGASREKAS